LADTIGVATVDHLTFLFTSLSRQYPTLEIGAHLHSNPLFSVEKIAAAFKAGCKRFDGALRGYGGCPMAEDKLVGNLATESIVSYLEQQQVNLQIDLTELQMAMKMADNIFPKH